MRFVILALVLCLTFGCAVYGNRDGFGASAGQSDIIVDDKGTMINGESVSATFASILGPIVGLAARFGLGAAGVPVTPTPPPDTADED